MSQTHYFFALALPSDVKDYLNESSRKLDLPFARWVHPEDYHLTLAFLGNAEEDKLLAAKEKVAIAAKRLESFSLDLDSFGTFGPKSNPRIFWAGVKESLSLNHLQKAVGGACAEADFQLDTKPFNPHITLARKWQGQESFQETVKAPLTLEQHTFAIKQVVLYQTHMASTPKYEVKNTFLLKEKDGRE
jgi:2'-5' RNA ligase